MLLAETWSTVAAQVHGREYPTNDFAHAWKQVLFNQFHDILAGTSLMSAYEDVRDTYGEAKAIAARHLHGALQSLSWAIDIPHEEDTQPLVVFNHHPWPVTAGVE
ncbi:MAG: alpha-mannosidase, partial [Chloroflexota bacterium]|nr:alpha-mannosidase [Chloroflexota bacterium]